MRTLFIIVFICLAGIFLCVPVLHAQQIDTTVYHQLKGVEVVEKARPSTTREATPLQVMDRSGIERLGITFLRCYRERLRWDRRTEDGFSP